MVATIWILSTLLLTAVCCVIVAVGERKDAEESKCAWVRLYHDKCFDFEAAERDAKLWLAGMEKHAAELRIAKAALGKVSSKAHIIEMALLTQQRRSGELAKLAAALRTSTHP